MHNICRKSRSLKELNEQEKPFWKQGSGFICGDRKKNHQNESSPSCLEGVIQTLLCGDSGGELRV